MLVYFSVLCLILLIGVCKGLKINGGGYLAKDNTLAVKGFFIMVVFFSHFNGYVPTYTAHGDIIYKQIIQWFGQGMVTLFLFYSGYGVMESIKRKGMDYARAIPKHRVLGTLVKFDIAVLLYLILAGVLKSEYLVKEIVLSFVAWESIGNSNWYIFAIMFLYLATWVSAMITRRWRHSHLWMVAGVGALSCLYIVSMALAGKDEWWYDTVLCYPVGMLYSLTKEAMEGCWKSHRGTWLVTLMLLIGSVVGLKYGTQHVLAHFLWMIVFALAVVVLSYRVAVDSKFLLWCGDYLFEIYILMRLPMIVFKEMGLVNIGNEVYFLVCLASTILLALLYRKSTQFIKL